MSIYITYTFTFLSKTDARYWANVTKFAWHDFLSANPCWTSEINRIINYIMDDYLKKLRKITNDSSAKKECKHWLRPKFIDEDEIKLKIKEIGLRKDQESNSDECYFLKKISQHGKNLCYKCQYRNGRFVLDGNVSNITIGNRMRKESVCFFTNTCLCPIEITLLPDETCWLLYKVSNTFINTGTVKTENGYTVLKIAKGE